MIHSNDAVMGYFARKYGLTSSFARDGVTLEQQLFDRSKYTRTILRDIIRAAFSGVANNPSKSIIISFHYADNQEKGI